MCSIQCHSRFHYFLLPQVFHFAALFDLFHAIEMPKLAAQFVLFNCITSIKFLIYHIIITIIVLIIRTNLHVIFLTNYILFVISVNQKRS